MHFFSNFHSILLLIYTFLLPSIVYTLYKPILPMNHIMNYNHFLINLTLSSLLPLLAFLFMINPTPSFLSNLVVFGDPVDCSHHHHPHHHHENPDEDDQSVISSICDNFPTALVPLETTNTSVFCVDQNSCCNFTTIQAAVDAVPNLSIKRNIIWINAGIY